MLHRLRSGWIVGAALTVLATAPDAQTPAPQTRFQGGTDLVQVDVSVLDGKRRPVTSLTQADFTLLVDGQPREIQAFTEISLPDRVQRSGAPWTRDVPSDVTSNQTAQQEGRLVVVVFDRTIPQGEPSATAKRTATAIVNQLGPGDLAAIVTTGGAETHNLTSDRSRLLRAINQSDVSTRDGPEAAEVVRRTVFRAELLLDQLNDPRCLCGVCVPQTLTRVADALQATPRRRKLVFFIGSDLILESSKAIGEPTDVGCEVPLKDARNAMFAALDRANVTVHSIDPSGLAPVGLTSRSSTTLGGTAARGRGMTETNDHLKRQGALSVLPDRTGGRTVMNTNAPDAQVSGIFRESDSYYVIGFRPTDLEKNGKPHAITVNVKRPGLKVHSRNTYTSSPVLAATRAAASAEPGAITETVRESLTGLLPAGDVPIDLTAAALATPGSKQSAVTLAVGVDALLAAVGGAAATQGVPFEIVASAFDRGGRPKGIARQTLDLSWPQAEAPLDRRFDVLSRLDLLPGDYEVRLAVSGGDPRRTASVFSYVSVPAFDALPFSLSNVVIGATSGTLTAPKDFLSGVLPIVPTTRREFGRTDTLVAFLRIYQGTGRSDPVLPVQVRSSVLDSQGKVLAGQTSDLVAARFAKERTAEERFALEMRTLPPGEYLLQIEAEMGARVAGRAVRFVVSGHEAPTAERTAARDTALATRIEQLVDTVMTSDDDATTNAALSEARTIFEREGIPSVAKVGDAAAYGFVLVNLLAQPEEFQPKFLAAVQSAGQTVPDDAIAFAKARQQQLEVQRRYKTRTPSQPQLRDEISRLAKDDQAVREKTDFDLEKMAEADRKTAGPLKEIFARYGVPTYDMVGVQAAKDFIVMVQHQSSEFRLAVLPKLKVNVDAGQADPEAYAMVYDRTQRDQGQNQLYGQQLECTTGKTLELAPMDDAANVDRRRAEMGMMRVEFYERLVRLNMPDMCGASSNPK